MTTPNPTPGPLSPEREAEPYRDDVREALEHAGWRETAEGHVVAENGALWTETNSALDSGIDAPDRAWGISFDSNVPGPVIVAAALTASGADVPALIAEQSDMARVLESAGPEIRRQAERVVDLETELDQARAERDEAFRCRDNALRAMRRDDVDVDEDLTDLFDRNLHGLYEWDGDDAAPDSLVRACVNAVRPVVAKLTEQRDELKKRPTAPDATEYGIRIPDGIVLRDGDTFNLKDQQGRLLQCRGRGNWPDAVLVQRTVRYGAWTEAE